MEQVNKLVHPCEASQLLSPHKVPDFTAFMDPRFHILNYGCPDERFDDHSILVSVGLCSHLVGDTLKDLPRRSKLALVFCERRVHEGMVELVNDRVQVIRTIGGSSRIILS